MKTSIILCCMLVYFHECAGQDLSHPWSIGISGGHFASDAGIMFSVATPYVFHNRISARITGALRWSEDYHTISSESASYPGIQLGIVYLIKEIDHVDIYVEGGVNCYFPNKLISDEHAVFGYYGLGGLDFALYSNTNFGISYFFEMGLAAHQINAEKLEGARHFRNGPIANTGIRIRL